MTTEKEKAKPSDIRIAEITNCEECPHVYAVDDHVMLCGAGEPKFVVSENGNPPHIIPYCCPLPKKGG